MAAKEKSAAILTLKEPGLMSKRGRKDIADWLRKQAAFFLKYGDEYSKTRFTARYLYRVSADTRSPAEPRPRRGGRA